MHWQPPWRVPLVAQPVLQQGRCARPQRHARAQPARGAEPAISRKGHKRRPVGMTARISQDATLLLASSSTVVASLPKVTRVRSASMSIKDENSPGLSGRSSWLCSPAARSSAAGSRFNCRAVLRTEVCTVSTTSGFTCRVRRRKSEWALRKLFYSITLVPSSGMGAGGELTRVKR